MTDYVVARYDYEARDGRELSLKVDEIIEVVRRDDSGWVEGRNLLGTSGWFPLSFVEKYTGPPPPKKGAKAGPIKKLAIPDKASRRKSVKMTPAGKKSPRESGEDVAVEGDGSILDHKDKTSAYLKKWLGNRATKVQLKQKGVWTGDVDQIMKTGEAPNFKVPKKSTIFGVPLSEVVATHGGPIPPIVRQCVELLRKTAMKEEGLFRISGIASAIAELGQTFSQPGAKPDLASMDCNAVSGCLKKFFRDLPQPLFPIDFYDSLISAQQQGTVEAKIAAIKPLLDSIPEPNIKIIRYLMRFLAQVAALSDINKMNPSNLGIVFGPTLLRSASEDLSGFTDPSSSSAGLVATIVANCEAIIGPEEPEPSAAPAASSSSSSSSSSSASSAEAKPEPPSKAAIAAVVAAHASKGLSTSQGTSALAPPKPVPAAKPPVNKPELLSAIQGASAALQKPKISVTKPEGSATDDLLLRPGIKRISAEEAAKHRSLPGVHGRSQTVSNPTASPLSSPLSSLSSSVSASASSAAASSSSASDEGTEGSGEKSNRSSTISSPLSSPATPSPALSPSSLSASSSSSSSAPPAVTVSPSAPAIVRAPASSPATPSPATVSRSAAPTPPPGASIASPSQPPKPYVAPAIPPGSERAASASAAPAVADKPKPAEKPPLPAKPALPPKPNVKKEERVEALYAFKGDASIGQITFAAGTVLVVQKKYESGWWYGVSDAGAEGLFPMNFVKILN